MRSPATAAVTFGLVMTLSLTLLAIPVRAQDTEERGTPRIAFWSGRDGNPEIYVVDADGRNLLRLTDTEPMIFDVEPAWSPDGSRIAFVHNFSEILVMDAEGENVRVLTTDGAHPSWSPEGTRIVFERDDRIWVMGADGENPQVLLPDQTGHHPAWSPDGARIVFTSAGELGRGDIWVMDVAGGDPRNLTNSRSNEGEPAWSPDGSKIAFSRDDLEPSNRSVSIPPDIWIMDPDGGNQQNLTNTPDWWESAPAWSRDGTRIAYSRGRKYRDDIWVMDGGGGNPRSIISNGYDPDWSP